MKKNHVLFPVIVIFSVTGNASASDIHSMQMDVYNQGLIPLNSLQTETEQQQKCESSQELSTLNFPHTTATKSDEDLLESLKNNLTLDISTEMNLCSMSSTRIL
jgi:hypothetical protein